MAWHDDLILIGSLLYLRLNLILDQLRRQWLIIDAAALVHDELLLPAMIGGSEDAFQSQSQGIVVLKESGTIYFGLVDCQWKSNNSP